MSFFSKDKSESDVADDPKLAESRDVGGVTDGDAEDEASTTGTSATPKFVGRVAGDDVGYAGQTGAEARAEAEQDD